VKTKIHPLSQKVFYQRATKQIKTSKFKKISIVKFPERHFLNKKSKCSLISHPALICRCRDFPVTGTLIATPTAGGQGGASSKQNKKPRKELQNVSGAHGK